MWVWIFKNPILVPFREWLEVMDCQERMEKRYVKNFHHIMDTGENETVLRKQNLVSAEKEKKSFSVNLAKFH